MKKLQMKKIKIILICPKSPPLGGIQRFAENLESICGENINYIKFHDNIPEGWRKTRTSKFTWNIIKRDGIVNTLKVVIYVLICFYKYIWLSLKERPQLVHILSSNNLGFFRNCVYLIISKIFGAKVIFHHLGQFDEMLTIIPAWMVKIIRLLFSYSDCHVTQSELLSLILRNYTKKPVYTLLNPVKFNKKTNRIICKDSIIKIYGIGYLGHSKGTDLIIKLCEKYREILVKRKIQFHLIGGGDIEYYKRIIKNKEISSIVTLHGVLSDAEKNHHLLNEADIFLMPSRAEGQPIALLEAMASGLPIIATAVGSIPEVLANNRGRIVDKESIDDILQSIIFYIENADEREKSTEKSLAYIKKYHGESIFNRSMMEIISKTINKECN